MKICVWNSVICISSPNSQCAWVWACVLVNKRMAYMREKWPQCYNPIYVSIEICIYKVPLKAFLIAHANIEFWCKPFCRFVYTLRKPGQKKIKMDKMLIHRNLWCTHPFTSTTTIERTVNFCYQLVLYLFIYLRTFAMDLISFSLVQLKRCTLYIDFGQLRWVQICIHFQSVSILGFELEKPICIRKNTKRTMN